MSNIPGIALPLIVLWSNSKVLAATPDLLAQHVVGQPGDENREGKQ